jgi:hypothetical protein
VFPAPLRARGAVEGDAMLEPRAIVRTNLLLTTGRGPICRPRNIIFFIVKSVTFGTGSTGK